MQPNDNELNQEVQKFYRLLIETNKEIYQGWQKHSKLVNSSHILYKVIEWMKWSIFQEIAYNIKRNIIKGW